MPEKNMNKNTNKYNYQKMQLKIQKQNNTIIRRDKLYN